MTDTLSMILTGDSMITRGLAMGEDDDARALAAHIGSADVALTNLEVLPNDFKGYPAQESGGTHLAAGAWVLDELTDLGFNLFPAATNHALDYSIEGLLATIDALNAKGVAWAGLGRNLAEARMPAYLDTDRASVALISACSTFARGQQASEQRPDMPGRPGLNPLRATTVYEVTGAQLAALREIAEAIGVEQRRQERIALGFGHPPADPAIFPFFDTSFRAAAEPGIRTEPHAGDLAAIAGWVREARGRADLVVMSLHAHDQGATREDPADFIQVFARAAIDEGAAVVVGHGPHLLRGMEIYRDRPIFYSLGNFVAQNDLVHKFPSDAYERFRVDPGLTPGEIARTRSDDGRRGFPSDPRYWETVVPRLEWRDGALASIELVPVTLGHGQPVHRRGRPRIARGEHARSILERFAALSAPFGTRIAVEGERGMVRMDEGRGR